MDEIQSYCQRFLRSQDSDAHRWLTACAPFMRLVEVFGAEAYTFLEVTAMLAPDSSHPLATVAAKLLVRRLAAGGPKDNV